jgi:HEAT repeat protein
MARIHFLCGALLLCSSSLLAAIPGRSSLEEIQKYKSGDFSKLLQKWESTPQGNRLDELLLLASNPTLSERSRYIALMGAAKLAQHPTKIQKLQKSLESLHEDRSWVLRSASLQVIQTLPDQSTNPKLRALALKSLKDRALVIRSQAVDVVVKFQSPEVTDALIDAALAKENHHGGKALWVPQKALRALAQLPAYSATRAWKLTELLAQKQNQELSSLTLGALEKLLPQEAAQMKLLPTTSLSKAWIEASRKHL